MTTRQPMREFMYRRYDEHDRPDQQQSVQTQKRWSRSCHFLPMQIADDEPAQNRKHREYMERRRERPTRSGQQPGKYPFRIDRGQLPVKEIPIVEFLVLNIAELI